MFTKRNQALAEEGLVKEDSISALFCCNREQIQDLHSPLHP